MYGIERKKNVRIRGEKGEKEKRLRNRKLRNNESLENT